MIGISYHIKHISSNKILYAITCNDVIAYFFFQSSKVKIKRKEKNKNLTPQIPLSAIMQNHHHKIHLGKFTFEIEFTGSLS